MLDRAVGFAFQSGGKNNPDNATTMPAMVGNVAFEMPAAMARALPDR